MLDINDVSLQSLKFLIGNDASKRSIQVSLDYAQTEGTAFPSTMLLGGPGLGKSSIATVIATEMAADFREVIGQSLSTTADLNQLLLLSATPRSVVHVDEAHELPAMMQTALYLALDKKTIFVNIAGRAPQPIRLPNFTLILSTTDEYALLPPLRDRMRLVLRLSYLSVAELTQVVLYRSRALGWDVHESVLPLIAQRAKGTPRLALRLLQSCRRVCRAEGQKTIRPKHLETACELDQIDPLGLDATEQRILTRNRYPVAITCLASPCWSSVNFPIQLIPLLQKSSSTSSKLQANRLSELLESPSSSIGRKGVGLLMSL